MSRIVKQNEAREKERIKNMAATCPLSCSKTILDLNYCVYENYSDFKHLFSYSQSFFAQILKRWILKA